MPISANRKTSIPAALSAKRNSVRVLSDGDRMTPVIVDVFGALAPAGVAAPFHVTRGHVAAVADAEQERALRTVGVFVHFAGRVNNESAGHHRDGLVRRAHGAAAFEA